MFDDLKLFPVLLLLTLKDPGLFLNEKTLPIISGRSEFKWLIFSGAKYFVKKSKHFGFNCLNLLDFFMIFD